MRGSVIGLSVALAVAYCPAGAVAGPLPKLLISGAAGQASALSPAAACTGAGPTSLVAPPIAVDFTSTATVGVEPTIEQFILGAREGQILLHLRVAAGARSTAERPEESILSSRVSETVAALPLRNEAVRGVLIEVSAAPGHTPSLQFAIAALIVQLKAARPTLEITVVFPPGLVRREESFARRVTAYADFVGIRTSQDWRGEADWSREELRKPLVLQVGPAEGGDEALAREYLDVLVDTGDTLVEAVWASTPSAAQVSTLCRSVAVLSAALDSGYASAPTAKAPVQLAAEGEQVRTQAFIHGTSPAVAFLARTAATPEQPRSLRASAPAPARFEVTCIDAMSGRRLQAAPASGPGQSATGCIADVAYALVSVRLGDADQRLYESVSVSGRGGLRVEEIIARWQQYRAAQKLKLENYVATCMLSLHFEPTTLGSGFDITLQLREFSDRQGRHDWVQTGFFVNGVKFSSSRGFPLPQLEPEKVMAQPLELALDQKYRYTLLGTEAGGGSVSYVIGVEPERADAVLFSGKIWIDGLTFRQVRMQLQQAGGRSNVLSHVETQEFELVSGPADLQVNLLRSIYVQQMVNAAGRSFLLEKRYRFSDYAINTPGFDTLIAEVHASDQRMFRETDQGLRVLRRESGARVVEAQADRIQSLLLGTLYEGTFDFPVPLAGLSFVDFDVRDTGAQLSVFFAGPILAANLSKQVNKKFRLGVDLALSGIPQENRIYQGNQLQSAESFWTWEETAGALASWQISSGVSLTASSYFTANLFKPTSDTAADFRSSGRGYVVQSGGELKMARHGFSFTATGLQGTRFGWNEIGYAAARRERLADTFLKYSGDFSKQFFLGGFSKAALTASYYGGERLDRFSRYIPSFLARPRVRGLPSGANAFDAVGVAGVLYGFNVFEAVKIEGSYNRAWGRNRDESHAFRTFDGLELDLGTIGPWGTFVQGTVTYAVRGDLERYRSRWGVYLLIFRPLGQ